MAFACFGQLKLGYTAVGGALMNGRQRQLGRIELQALSRPFPFGWGAIPFSASWPSSWCQLQKFWVFFFFLVGWGGGVEAQGENETENRLLCVEKFSTFVSHTQNGVYLLVLLGSSNSLSLSLQPLCCLSKFFEMHSHTQPRTHHRIVPLLHTKLNFFLWFLFNFYMALWLILWHFLPALFSCTLHWTSNQGVPLRVVLSVFTQCFWIIQKVYYF